MCRLMALYCVCKEPGLTGSVSECAGLWHYTVSAWNLASQGQFQNVPTYGTILCLHGTWPHRVRFRMCRPMALYYVWVRSASLIYIYICISLGVQWSDQTQNKTTTNLVLSKAKIPDAGCLTADQRVHMDT